MNNESAKLVSIIESLQREVAGLKEENMKLKGQILLLLAENKRLHAIISKDSSNSSKPPSTDIGKKQKNNSRQKTSRKCGGQEGHKGSSLSPVEKPDNTVVLTPTKCKCGYCFNGNESVFRNEKRQVFDIPPPKSEVTEYVSGVYECPDCKTMNQHEFPGHVKSTVQYGPVLKSYAIYLMNYQLLPYKRTSELFANMHDLPVSEGSLNNFLREYDVLIEAPVTQIKQNIIDAETVHFDESGLYCQGKRDWVHVASNQLFTYYHHHESRGIKAVEDAGILEYFRGTAVHDYWKTYYKFDSCSHSLCNAHHLRDLQGIFDTTGLQWAKDMKELFSEMKKEVDKAKANGLKSLPPEKLDSLTDKFNDLIAKGYKETPPPVAKKKGARGRPLRGKPLSLLDRFEERTNEILDFIFDFEKPFDNNQAERDIRMIKVKQKISGSFRSSEMAQAFCRIRSFISTAIKHNKNILNVIADVYKGETFLYQH